MTNSSTALMPQVGMASDKGRSGKINEDRFEYFVISLSERGGGELYVAVVADGIGGQAKGELASQTAIDAVKQYLNEHRSEQLESVLREAIRHAARTVYKLSEDMRDSAGMGTTIAIAAILRNQLYVGAVGDSRVYLFNGSSTPQISIDHTAIQEALDANKITVEAAKTHPNRNVIRRYLGIDPDVRVDDGKVVFPPRSLASGDTIVISSDGLTDLVPDDDLRNIVTKRAPQDAANQLIKLANERGGDDNITAMVLRMSREGAKAAAPFILPWKPIVAFLSMLLLVGIGILAFAGIGRAGGPEPTATAVAVVPVATSQPILQTSAPFVRPTQTDTPTSRCGGG